MPGLSTPFLVSIYCWFAWEVGLLVRDLVRRKGRQGQDRGTRVIVSLALAGSIWIGILLRRWLPALDTPAPNAFAVAGVVVIWVGLALRVWAVLTLGRSFSTFFQVDVDQTVVTGGPYRWVRHPSYTGLLLIALGFGLGAGNWLSWRSARSSHWQGCCPVSRSRRPSWPGYSATSTAATRRQHVASYRDCGRQATVRLSRGRHGRLAP
jgi:protein-S-isoprenylcysteine O-methyltransferase Ste14